MTDLVERLRYGGAMALNPSLVREAADEIERLRAEIGVVSEKLMIAGTDNAGLRAELAAIKGQEPVAEVHPNNLRPQEDGKHWCREVLLYSGNNPGDLSRGTNYRTKLFALPVAPVADKDAHYEVLERKHLGDPDKETGIYAPLQERQPKDADPFNCPNCGRHDFGLYGYCPSCDAAMAKGE